MTAKPTRANTVEPPLAQPGAWAGAWRRMGVKAALAVR
jgi:hypothetical protein